MASAVQVLPPEIYIKVIEAVTSATNPRAYSHSPEAIKTLKNLALVSRAFHEWSTGELYRRVSVSEHQISQLRVALWPRTKRSIALASRIRALMMVMAGKENARGSMTGDALHVLRSVADTLQRLFLDLDISHTALYCIASFHNPLTLHAAIASLSSLSELVLGHAGQHSAVIWPNQIPLTSLSKLRRVAVTDLGGVDPNNLGLLDAFANLEELIFLRPWQPQHGLERMGADLAAFLTALPRLERIVFVLTKAEPWEVHGLRELTVEGLGTAMLPHRRKVTIVSNQHPDVPLHSWEEVSRLICRGELGIEERMARNEWEILASAGSSLAGT